MSDRFYLVTFDLVNSRGREAEYAKARVALKFLAVIPHVRYLRTLATAALLSPRLLHHGEPW